MLLKKNYYTVHSLKYEKPETGVSSLPITINQLHLQSTVYFQEQASRNPKIREARNSHFQPLAA